MDRKRIYRILAAILVVCLLLCGCTASAADTGQDLTELYEDLSTHWAKSAIRYCLENGYMTGLSATEFGPDESVTRAQVVQSLYYMAGSPSLAGMDCPFVDIAGHEARGAIFWAYNAGIASGTGGNAFNPDDSISREQIAAMFKSYREFSLGEPIELSGTYLDRFTDRKNVSIWAVDAMNWAIQSGLMAGGSGPDRLDPQSGSTRAQLAVFIQNYYEPFRGLTQWEEPQEGEKAVSRPAASNSELVNYVRMSPNHSGRRNHTIDTITIHCMAGNMTVEQCGELFADPTRQASSNYAIGTDGRIALYVDERNRSWCSSSAANDNRAVTIEVANNGGGPEWPVSAQAYASLIDLVTDICWRNGIKRLLWQGDETLIGQVDRQNMTVHRWFANKSCPGEYLYNHHGDIAAKVNLRLISLETAQALDAAAAVYDNMLKG